MFKSVVCCRQIGALRVKQVHLFWKYEWTKYATNWQGKNMFQGTENQLLDSRTKGVLLGCTIQLKQIKKNKKKQQKKKKKKKKNLNIKQSSKNAYFIVKNGKKKKKNQKKKPHITENKARCPCNVTVFCSTGTRWYKENKWTQELIQSDPHQTPDTKGKDRQIQLSRHKMNRWQSELATLSPKRWQLCYPKLKRI